MSTIQLKRGPATSTSNPILKDGQPYVVQTDPPRLRIGDGTSHVNSLPYLAAGYADSAGSATTAASCTGNAASATKLATARNIGNASFNGTANITLSQIGAAAASHTHTASQVTGLTANRALVSDSSGHPAASSITSTKLSYLANVSSDIQTQLNGKASSDHTHTASQVSGLPSSLKNPYSLTIQVNGSNNIVYDGSSAKSINLTPSLIGALPSKGVASSATKLATARKIGNASFNGTANITLDQIGALAKSSGLVLLDSGSEAQVSIPAGAIGTKPTDVTIPFSTTGNPLFGYVEIEGILVGWVATHCRISGSNLVVTVASWFSSSSTCTIKWKIFGFSN